MTRYFILLVLLIGCGSVYAQVDTTEVEEEFDFSDFELAAEPVKAFCNNKVLSQSPTSLISISHEVQGAHTFNPQMEIAGLENIADEEAQINAIHTTGFQGNFPIVSRNNILINLGVNYFEYRYDIDDKYNNPLTRNLANHPLRRAGLQLTVFKPLNEKRFLLAQLGTQLNGDYVHFDYQPASTLRIPAALIYGFKPSDRLMWGAGVARTYLGGALNYLPIIYYFHTFQNQKWGIEAVVPSRVNLRYRLDNKNIFTLGYTVTGATFRLNNFRGYEEDFIEANDGNILPLGETNFADNIELRRSELKIAGSYMRGITDFIWAQLTVGVRANWLFNVDEGEFFRGFDDSDFYMDNQLGAPVFVRLNLSFVTP